MFAVSTTALLLASPISAATLVGAFSFDGSLASTVGGPSLGVIDPTGTSGFVTDTVFGESRTVWAFNGNTNPVLGQSGLTYDSTGLVSSTSYSIALTFKFNERQNSWRRIFDVEGRQSDSGFYIDPSNNLDIYPVTGSGVPFNSGVYRNVVLTVDGTTVSGYADGGASFTAATNVMAIGDDPLIFFADNVVGGGQGEWSSGTIAALRIYDGVLTPEEIADLNGDPFVPPSAVPEPASWALMIGGFALAGGTLRRRATVRLARA